MAADDRVTGFLAGLQYRLNSSAIDTKNTI
jgi:hypothetical protein